MSINEYKGFHQTLYAMKIYTKKCNRDSFSKIFKNVIVIKIKFYLKTNKQTKKLLLIV